MGYDRENSPRSNIKQRFFCRMGYFQVARPPGQLSDTGHPLSALEQAEREAGTRNEPQWSVWAFGTAWHMDWIFIRSNYDHG